MFCIEIIFLVVNIGYVLKVFKTQSINLMNLKGIRNHPSYLYFKNSFAFLLLINLSLLQAQDWQEVLSTAASDGALGAFEFGYSVSVSGNYAIVGAPKHYFDESGSNSMQWAGAAFLFERDGSGNWTEVQKIVPSDRAVNDRFGYSVFISGDFAYVGAIFEDEDAAGSNTLSGAGSAYIFERVAGTWTQIQKIVASDREDLAFFGNSISVSGDYMIVGAYNETKDASGLNSLSDAGAAYFFQRSGGVWSQMQKVVGSYRNFGDQFGWSVSISGDYAVVGVIDEDEDASGANTLATAGAAYIFERSGGTWSQVKMLVSSARESNAKYGHSVSISGDYVAIGSIYEDTDASNANALTSAGAAYIYDRNGGAWSLMQKVVASDRTTYVYFGESVSIDGNNLVVGGHGEKRDVAGANSLNNAGAAYIFQLSGSTWSQVQKLVASDRASNGYFGSAVAISGDYIVSGAYYYNSQRGQAYIIEFPRWTFEHGGYALDFDGTDDYVSIADANGLDLTNGFTLEAWVYPESSSAAYSRIITKPNAYGFGFNNAELIFTTYGVKDYKLTYTMPTDTWTHYAVVMDGSNHATFYINGLDKGTVTGTTAASTSADDLYLGRGLTLGTQQLDGKIDEVRIWGDIRTQAEIQANMNRELVGDEANLSAYYLMYDSTGTTLTDNTGNELSGTITNGAAWQTSGALAGPDMAITTDGVEDYALATLTATASTALTIEGWINFNSLSGQQNLYNLHKNSNSTIRLVPYKTSANVINLYVYDGANTSIPVSTFTVSQTGQWHHMAFIYNAGTVIIYVDGVEVANTSILANGFGMETTNKFSIGADFNGTNGQFHSNAKYDEVRVWSDVRTAAEIRDNMYHTLRGDETDLLAYYRCDQQSSTSNNTLYDMTGNGNDATFFDTDETLAWVSSNPFNTWIGGEDSDWNNTANWSLGTVPVSENIGIYLWSGNNMPALANISGRDFYVAPDVAISSSSDLTLSGNFYNEGSYISTGTTTFSGTAAQSIEGNGTTSFGTMIVNNSSGASMEKDITVTSALNLTNGALSIGANTLTINGSISQTSGSLSGGSSSNISIGGSGASTSLPAVTLNNLTLNRGNGISIGGTATINGTLTLTDGILDLNSQALVLGNSAAVGGAPASSIISMQLLVVCKKAMLLRAVLIFQWVMERIIPLLT